jgi:hypothetical protein
MWFRKSSEPDGLPSSGGPIDMFIDPNGMTAAMVKPILLDASSQISYRSSTGTCDIFRIELIDWLMPLGSFDYV